jgi:hypothetical protein
MCCAPQAAIAGYSHSKRGVFAATRAPQRCWLLHQAPLEGLAIFGHMCGSNRSHAHEIVADPDVLRLGCVWWVHRRAYLPVTAPASGEYCRVEILVGMTVDAEHKGSSQVSAERARRRLVEVTKSC